MHTLAESPLCISEFQVVFLNGCIILQSQLLENRTQQGKTPKYIPFFLG